MLLCPKIPFIELFAINKNLYGERINFLSIKMAVY